MKRYGAISIVCSVGLLSSFQSPAHTQSADLVLCDRLASDQGQLDLSVGEEDRVLDALIDGPEVVALGPGLLDPQPRRRALPRVAGGKRHQAIDVVAEPRCAIEISCSQRLAHVIEPISIIQ